jgi:hypothetical protein
MEPIILPIVLVVIIYTGLAFLRPHMAIYLLVFFSIFDLGFFSRWIGVTRYFARIPFFLAGLLALIFMINFFTEKLTIEKKDRLIRMSIKFIFLLILITIFSNLYNNENLILGLFELRYFYILFIFVICFGYYLPKLTTINNFILFCVIIGLLQIPFTVFQYITVQIIGIKLSKSALDMSSGTFSSYSALVFLQCIAIAVIFEYQLNFKKPLLKISNYFVAVLLIVPLLLSYSRTVMGFVVLTVIFVFSRDIVKNINPAKMIKRSIALVFISFIFVFAFLHFFYEVHHITQQLSVNYIVDYFMREPLTFQEYQAGEDAVMGRARAITEAISLVSRDFVNFLIGMGSGSSSEASLIGAKGSYYFEYGPLAGIGRVQLSKVIIELGFLGTFIIVSFFVKIFFISKQRLSEEEGIVINNIFINLLFIVLLNSLYSTILHTEVSMLIIGFLIAVIYRATDGNVHT